LSPEKIMQAPDTIIPDWFLKSATNWRNKQWPIIHNAWKELKQPKSGTQIQFQKETLPENKRNYNCEKWEYLTTLHKELYKAFNPTSPDKFPALWFGEMFRVLQNNEWSSRLDNNTDHLYSTMSDDRTRKTIKSLNKQTCQAITTHWPTEAANCPDIRKIAEPNFIFPPFDSYSKEGNMIVMNPFNTSIITYFHEMGHWLYGPDELKASQFSYKVFKTLFPKAIGKLEWHGNKLQKPT